MERKRVNIHDERQQHTKAKRDVNMISKKNKLMIICIRKK